jgi:hypothetical protein
MSVQTEGRWDCRTGAFSNEPCVLTGPFSNAAVWSLTCKDPRVHGYGDSEWPC